MNLSCGSRTIKYLIFSFNFVFVITGIILIAVGASIHAYYIKYDYFLNNQYFSLTNLLIATGTLIFVISFLGCYGAMKNSWIMLMAFSALLGVIFIFEFSAGIAGYVLRDKTSNYLENTMKGSLKSYQSLDPTAILVWDHVQENFECCGVTDMTDWTKLFNSTDLPISCCPQKPGTTGTFTCSAYQQPLTTTVAPTTTSTTGNATVTPTGNDTAPTTGNETTSPAGNATTPTSNATTVSPSDTTNTITTVAANISISDEMARHVRSLREIPVPSTTVPYPIGCEPAFGNWVKVHAVDIGAVCFTLAVLQLIGIGFACHLSKQLKNSYYST